MDFNLLIEFEVVGKDFWFEFKVFYGIFWCWVDSMSILKFYMLWIFGCFGERGWVKVVLLFERNVDLFVVSVSILLWSGEYIMLDEMNE